MPTDTPKAVLELAEREIPTSELAKLIGEPAWKIRKWKMRGDLKLAPTAYAGAGRGNEAMWSPAAVEEVKRRAAEKRTAGYRAHAKEQADG